MSRQERSKPTRRKRGSSTVILIAVIMMLVCFSSVILFLVANPSRREKAMESNNLNREEVSKIPKVPVDFSGPKGHLATVKNDSLAMLTLSQTTAPVIAPVKENIISNQDYRQQFRLHFIHIPKCGGTSMTAVLRQVMCDADPIHMQDCCTNPGFCDIHAGRKCAAIKGCVSHFANRNFIFKSMPSVTIMRRPVSRLVSAWFYRCHSPNSDCFQVRPEFKLIKKKLQPQATFDEYLDMVEYNNIMTRMLGAGSFPYKNISITEKIYDDALIALDKMFFVGLQEAYELSVEIMLRELGSKTNPNVKKEREQKTKKMSFKKLQVTGNATLMDKAAQVNSFDIRLYDRAVARFCKTLRKYPDLMKKLSATGVTC